MSRATSGIKRTKRFKTISPTLIESLPEATPIEGFKVSIELVAPARETRYGRPIEARWRLYYSYNGKRFEHRNSRNCVTSSHDGSWTISNAKIHGGWILDLSRQSDFLARFK